MNIFYTSTSIPNQKFSLLTPYIHFHRIFSAEIKKNTPISKGASDT